MDGSPEDTIIQGYGARKIKKALISVANKSGLDKLVPKLIDYGIEVVATSGTRAYLHEIGIDVAEVADLTGTPELMEGRVKTLHPEVHAGILAQPNKQDHIKTLEDNQMTMIDMVIVNLESFTNILSEYGEDEQKCLDAIDIGGIAMMRSAAKNYKYVCVVTDPRDYDVILTDIKTHDGAVTESLRKRLANNAFSLAATYDSNIAGWFTAQQKSDHDFPGRYGLSGSLKQVLRHGENPHQKAAIYDDGTGNRGVVNAKQLQGPLLSYNEMLDADSGYKLLSTFEEPCAVILKHTSPFGVSCSETILDAYKNALEYSPDSIAGGCVCLNRPLDKETADEIIRQYTSVVIAPSISADALDILGSKEDISVLATGDALDEEYTIKNQTRSLLGGFLVQTPDVVSVTAEDLDIVTEREPTARELEDLLFAFQIARYVQSNAIVYARDKKTLGIGVSPAARIDAAFAATRKSEWVQETKGLETPILKNSVVASDGHFSDVRGLITAVDAGVTAVIQPGGSARDDEIIAAADDRAIAMVFTKSRHLRH